MTIMVMQPAPPGEYENLNTDTFVAVKNYFTFNNTQYARCVVCLLGHCFAARTIQFSNGYFKTRSVQP